MMRCRGPPPRHRRWATRTPATLTGLRTARGGPIGQHPSPFRYQPGTGGCSMPSRARSVGSRRTRYGGVTASTASVASRSGRPRGAALGPDATLGAGKQAIAVRSPLRRHFITPTSCSTPPKLTPAVFRENLARLPSLWYKLRQSEQFCYERSWCRGVVCGARERQRASRVRDAARPERG